jgi:protein-tyrosine phosphatase
MLDIHHHLLFGLDDGPADIETSVEMALASIADGVTHIACTPHASYDYEYKPEVNSERLAAVRERLDERIELGIGCDFHLSHENIEDAIAHPDKYSINGKGYILVEFPDFSIPPSISDVFFRMQIAGMTIVLTHPERNPTIVTHPEWLREWLRHGCLVQVTAASFSGRFGKSAQRFSDWLLDNNWIHFVATDAHNMTSRPPHLKEAYDYVAARRGIAEAERLFVLNPRAAWDGTPLSEQPDPVALWEDSRIRHIATPGARRGFFARIFGG